VLEGEGIVQLSSTQTRYSVEMKARPTYSLNVFYFMFFFFFLVTELEKQLSDKCLNFNVTYKHFMHRSETIIQRTGGRVEKTKRERARDSGSVSTAHKM